MATVLHIRSTRRGERSFSLRAAEAFLDAYSHAHPDDAIETLDLDAGPVPEFDATASAGKYRILHGEEHTPEEAAAWRTVVETVDRFRRADKIVISAPMWNFGIPYRLKQYIDVIVQPGLTFAFSPEEGYTGLVTGRPALLILARGGSYTGEEAAAFDFQKPYLETILRFIGFDEIDSIVIEPTLADGPDVADEKLDAAIATARRLAETF